MINIYNRNQNIIRNNNKNNNNKNNNNNNNNNKNNNNKNNNSYNGRNLNEAFIEYNSNNNNNNNNGNVAMNFLNNNNNLQFQNTILNGNANNINNNTLNLKNMITCKICTLKKINRVLKCGHPFCNTCLRDWFRVNGPNQIHCPTCRALIRKTDIIKLFL